MERREFITGLESAPAANAMISRPGCARPGHDAKADCFREGRSWIRSLNEGNKVTFTLEDDRWGRGAGQIEKV